MSAQLYTPSFDGNLNPFHRSGGQFYAYGTQGYYDAIANEEQAAADSIGGKLTDAIGITHHSADAASAKTMSDRAYEQQATNSARAWDEYMQSTYYQRMVNDLKAAGLNPWLALNSGIGQTNNVSTAGSGSSARYKSEEKNKTNAGTVVAGFLIAAARVIAALVA